MFSSSLLGTHLSTKKEVVKKFSGVCVYASNNCNKCFYSALVSFWVFVSYICISEDITLHGVHDFGIEFFGVNAKHFTFLFSKGVVIVNSVYRDGRNFPGLLKPVVLFFLVMKIFVRFLPSYQNILPQILKVRGTKTCSYLRTDK